VDKLWKESDKTALNSKFFDPAEGPPCIVLIAVGLLALLFLSASIYLFVSGPFTGIKVIAPAELPEVTAALVNYQGTIWGLEKARKGVWQELEKLGLHGGQPITVFSKSPMFMRPIAIHCQVGYILPLGFHGRKLSDSIRIQRLRPGRRLVVRVSGKGNFTGAKAYRAARKKLRTQGLHLAEGERFEVKVEIQGQSLVEHWIPVR